MASKPSPPINDPSIVASARSGRRAADPELESYAVLRIDHGLAAPRVA
jgi:hypothetical protein